MSSLIAMISSNVTQIWAALRQLGTVAMKRHLEYCELLAEAQRRY